jgi:F-type H+-transporting ATPase subunit b
MFTSSLFLAVAEVHSGEATSGITKIMDDFGINVPSLAAQALSFATVVFVLWRFAFRPVLATLEERKNKIESGLKYAAEMQAKLAATQQETAQLIKTAQLEGQKIVDEVRKTAKEFAEKQNAEATARAADTLAKAQQAIELEHKKMLNEARGEIARLVVKTTEQVLAKKLSEADRAAYNDLATRELTAS